MRIKKQTTRRACIFLCILLSAFIFAPMCFATEASAEAADPEYTGVDEIDSVFNNFFSILFGVIRFGGIAAVVWGVFQFGQSFPQHDPTARITGVLIIAGGLIAIYLRDLLRFIGVSV